MAKLNNMDSHIQVGSCQIQPSMVVRDLGVHSDSQLSMKHHVAKVRSCMGKKGTIRLVLALVSHIEA